MAVGSAPLVHHRGVPEKQDPGASHPAPGSCRRGCLPALSSLDQNDAVSITQYLVVSRVQLCEPLMVGTSVS